MPVLQLESAVLLTAVALVSATLTYRIGWPKEGKIALPVHSDDGFDATTDVADPFNVVKPEDWIDGYPIDEEHFWRKMRLRKITQLALAIINLVLHYFVLGWALANEEGVRNVTVALLRIFYSHYYVLLCAHALSLTSVEAHWRNTIHLSVVSSAAFWFQFTAAIIPTREVWDSTTRSLWYVSLALWFAAFVIALRTKRGPKLHFPSERIYSEKILAGTTTTDENNVCGVVDASVWDVLLFTYTTKVVMLGYTSASLEIGDLPIVPADMRASTIFATMKAALRLFASSPARCHQEERRGLARFRSWVGTWGNGWQLAFRVLRVNGHTFALQTMLVITTASLYYAPAFFLQRLVYYLEQDPLRTDMSWGWVYCAGLFLVNALLYILTAQLWSLSTNVLQVRMKVQLNTTLFAKTLVRKDIASSSGASSMDKKNEDSAKRPPPSTGTTFSGPEATGEKKAEEGEFSSKAQIMTLMTTDVDRVSEFAWHCFSLVDSPIEIVIGTVFLYKLLGVSCFFGLATTCLFLPMNHYAGKVVVFAQDNLMKARDERVALMNEVLGGIRMLKFMAWERNFEARVLRIREKELGYQRLNYILETLFNTIWNACPLFVTVISFWHFAVFRGQTLKPSIAFTSIAVFSEMKFALNALPETFINMLQSFVSLRRIEKYLNTAEVAPVPPLDGTQHPVVIQSATITWPQDRASGSSSGSVASSAASTPRRKFSLIDVSLNFPLGELSLVCGKLGSGKTLLLLSLLGEADLLAGQISSPRTPPDTIASFTAVIPPHEEWVVPGVSAYVPQSAWLRNASIRENILFNLPYVEERYRKTLEVCALVADLKILEDGDQSEIGERGVNLSGGQKARVSLARAVYSRASLLLLDDVLSAVDAHTAHHLFHECLKGELMQGRTVIVISHHVQLCVPGSSYIVALDNGRVAFAGNPDDFKSSSVMATLVQSDSTAYEDEDAREEKVIEDLPKTSASSTTLQSEDTEPSSETSSTAAASTDADGKSVEKKSPRRLIEEEKRAVGRIGKDIWKTYFSACGGKIYWTAFVVAVTVASMSAVFENGWLRIWSRDSSQERTTHEPMFYITIYALVTLIGLLLSTIRWFVLYAGSIHASTVLYKRLLEAVLFAQIRFHDTISRGRLLNRFGKDFEGIDSSLSDNFGRSVINAVSVCVTLITVTIVGGLQFLLATIVLGYVYFNVAKVYGQCSRDMRRLDSVSRSPLYSIYGETIAGVPVLRAFGAGSKFLRDMLSCVDTNTNPYYWLWGVNRWVGMRFNLLSSAVVGIVAVIALINPRIDASLAGFILAFASTVTNDLLFMVRRFVGLEQSMVAVERVKEFSELDREGPEFIEPRPPASWPSEGSIVCENLIIRYAPELPNVLHNLNFEVRPGEKIGILGRTGSGKSTLALSFFRFVEATEGRILVDGIDIATVGLTDLRSRLTIIPQDPTILSGTLRSTLDVFGEYEDAEIFEALRRVHLIPSEHVLEDPDELNVNVFRDLDSPVSEGGENFSTGEKQLLCMARAILKRSKLLVMDEATASVDYATDELIGRTIRHEFAGSTILTIAHRLRTVIDYDKVMLLDQGRIVEYDSPSVLLADPTSQFYGLCRATGKEEFAGLKRLAGLQTRTSDGD